MITQISLASMRPNLMKLSMIVTIHDSDIKIPNYNIIRKDRDKFGGGVVMYIRESLNYKLREDLDFDIESISAEIKVGNFRSFIVTSLYRPPQKPVEYFDRIEALISAIDSGRKESIIIGIQIVIFYVIAVTTLETSNES